MWKFLTLRLLVGSVVTGYVPYSILSSHPGPAPTLLSALTVTGVFLIAVGTYVFLRCVLKDHFDYYHKARPHQSLEFNSPYPREIEPQSKGNVIAIPQDGIFALNNQPVRRLAPITVYSHLFLSQVCHKAIRLNERPTWSTLILICPSYI